MKHTIYLIAIITLFTACKQNVNDEAITDNTQAQEATTISLATDTAIVTIQQPDKTEAFDPEKLVGKYRMWNKENNCYAIAEISKESNQYNAGFYLECEEQAGFSDIVEIKDNTLYMKPEGDYNGCSIWLDKGKLAVKWKDSKTIEYYSKF